MRHPEAEQTCVTLPADCDVPSAPERLHDLRTAVKAASRDRPLHLDLTGGPPTAIALQLIAAAAASLTRAQAFAGYGPAAAAVLGLEQARGDRDVEDRPIRG